MELKFASLLPVIKVSEIKSGPHRAIKPQNATVCRALDAHGAAINVTLKFMSVKHEGAVV